MNEIYRGRFAPSPTGPLHFGSLVAAFGSWLCARHRGGEWWVRIEDVDLSREVANAAELQLSTLAAFGLHSDAPIVRQSKRSDLYIDAVSQLSAKNLAFECFCSRNDLQSTYGIHRRCVNGNSANRDRTPAIRFRVEEGTAIEFDDAVYGRITQDVARAVGDFVLKRADGYWAYQFAVTIDDAAQGMTDIVRGADLLGSTPRQILLQRTLGLKTPQYLHLPLALDSDGRKLSKSSAAFPVEASMPVPALRAAWRLLGQPEDLLQTDDLARLLHIAPKLFRPELIPRVLPASWHCATEADRF